MDALKCENELATSTTNHNRGTARVSCIVVPGPISPNSLDLWCDPYQIKRIGATPKCQIMGVAIKQTKHLPNDSL